jgi:hypothetical protein
MSLTALLIFTPANASLFANDAAAIAASIIVLFITVFMRYFVNASKRAYAAKTASFAHRFSLDDFGYLYGLLCCYYCFAERFYCF